MEVKVSAASTSTHLEPFEPFIQSCSMQAIRLHAPTQLFTFRAVQQQYLKEAPSQSLAVDSDGLFVAAGAGDGRITVWPLGATRARDGCRVLCFALHVSR